ncbi:uncharacterized protein EI97DRAFT_419231 [Westerdykella ornata]|uniref:Uncharacterized protein n=1 Tax=Westerdykella ornata TaxID=318751 RepID=A0A6A6JJ49_WESOR|nr:uncharacterized protein EI97DRAFT_419231 [Westerdykella ornata]KAF2276274.1 hypothetical protein EI97DRAFT_419231 [Westerdykella ornata]
MDEAGPQTSRPGQPAVLSSRNSGEPQTSSTSTDPPRVQQPRPQALPSRSGPSSILVSPRQKGNPILNSVRSAAWEYSDIPADYVLGATTCALFLSLKYHRLHPEYIYNRIRDLKGQYKLRVLLTMVDIENHEETLRELSKTSLINNVTIMLCWSAQEAGRYLELFKTFEHAAPTSIRAQQSTSYSDNLVDFITVPRSINKTDALGLVSNFGSIRTAINASPEEIGMIAGWGEKKVQRWCNAVREPFRVQKAAKRGPNSRSTRATMSGDVTIEEGAGEAREEADADKRPPHRLAEDGRAWQLDGDVEEAMREAERVAVEGQSHEPSTQQMSANRTSVEEPMTEGIMAALNKLRQHLPSEIQLQVFSYADIPTLKAARRVSRQYRDNASQYLFKQALICPRKIVLRARRNISQHPVYSTYVGELVFDASIADPYLVENPRIYDRRVEVELGPHGESTRDSQRYYGLCLLSCLALMFWACHDQVLELQSLRKAFQ